MKLLLDQNLSWKLVKQLEELYPGTVHISSALSTISDDHDIWLYAKSNGFAIVTKTTTSNKGAFCLSTLQK